MKGSKFLSSPSSGTHEKRNAKGGRAEGARKRMARSLRAEGGVARRRVDGRSKGRCRSKKIVEGAASEEREGRKS